ncbi:hypothetical protein HDK64DRAFT_313523 [Phyllosticta capitalensis]
MAVPMTAIIIMIAAMAFMAKWLGGDAAVVVTYPFAVALILGCLGMLFFSKITFDTPTANTSEHPETHDL